MIRMLGLKNCDTCKKAQNWLHRFELPFSFEDYREQRISAADLKAYAQSLGGWEKLINKASTTWRNLPDSRKAPGSDPEWQLLLKEHPALIKRPLLITEDGTVSVGFSDNSYKARFGVRK